MHEILKRYNKKENDETKNSGKELKVNLWDVAAHVKLSFLKDRMCIYHEFHQWLQSSQMLLTTLFAKIFREE